MPMVDYQIVNVNSQSDIIGEIFSFASSNGWTVDGDVVGDGADCWARIYQDGDDIAILGSRDQGLSNTPPNHSIINARTMLGVPWSPQGVLHLFAHDNPKALWAIYNYSSDAYQWLSLGNIVKYGTVTGGTWSFATSKHFQSNDIEAPPRTDSITNNRPGALLMSCDTAGIQSNRPNGSWFYVETGDPGAGDSWCHSNMFSDSTYPRHGHATTRGGDIGNWQLPLFNRGPNAWNEQTVLLPLVVHVRRESGMVSIAGHAPGIRFCRLDNLSREEEITIGEMTYKVFPWFQRAEGANGSRMFGFAMELPELP